MSQSPTENPPSDCQSVCAEETFRFNYQDFVSQETPQVTCVVPSNWLYYNLPTMGGAVKYIVDWTGGGICRITSYLQTMAYKGVNPMIAIQMALVGEIWGE